VCVQYTLEREGVIEKRVEKRTFVEEGTDDTDHDKVNVDIFSSAFLHFTFLSWHFIHMPFAAFSATVSVVSLF